MESDSVPLRPKDSIITQSSKRESSLGCIATSLGIFLLLSAIGCLIGSMSLADLQTQYIAHNFVKLQINTNNYLANYIESHKVVAEYIKIRFKSMPLSASDMSTWDANIKEVLYQMLSTNYKRIAIAFGEDYFAVSRIPNTHSNTFQVEYYHQGKLYEPVPVINSQDNYSFQLQTANYQNSPMTQLNEFWSQAVNGNVLSNFYSKDNTTLASAVVPITIGKGIQYLVIVDFELAEFQTLLEKQALLLSKNSALFAIQPSMHMFASNYDQEVIISNGIAKYLYNTSNNDVAEITKEFFKENELRYLDYPLFTASSGNSYVVKTIGLASNWKMLMFLSVSDMNAELLIAPINRLMTYSLLLLFCTLIIQVLNGGIFLKNLFTKQHN